MSTIEKSHSEKSKSTEPQQNKDSDENAFLTFVKNHKAATVLSILLIIGLIGFSIKIRQNEKKFNEEKTKLLMQSQKTIDSLQIKHIEFATEVFSWSVRSELLRNNTENLNQLLTVFVKESDADLVQIINAEDKMVLISSDKKFEGAEYTGTANFEINETVIIKEGNLIKIITPVMGFNKIIGILITEMKLK
jgi:hypothetical protein